MEGFVHIVKTNRWFFIPFVIWLLVGGAALLFYGSSNAFLDINALMQPEAAQFFKYQTYSGDGLFAALVSVLLLLKNRSAGLAAGASFALSGLFAQLLKHTLFAGSPRPKQYFENLNHKIRFADGVEVFSSNSFPSGHSTTAFGLFLMLALLTRNKLSGIFFFSLAMLTGFSRVYLAQHFPADVYAGSLAGVCITLLCYRFICTKNGMNLEIF